MAGEGGGDDGSVQKKRRIGVFASCCCCPDSGSEDGGKDHEVVIPKPRRCTDSAFLVLYVTFCCILLLIGVFAHVYGNPLRLINGMDSFGNVCGTTNENANLSFSGKDMTEKPYVFFFDLEDMDQSVKICVSSCPQSVLRNMDALIEHFHNTSTNLCRYDFDIEEWNKSTSSFNNAQTDIRCPLFPVPSSLPVLKRCIPAPSAMFRGKSFFKIYAYLNNLNIFKQVLGDLAATWDSVLVLTSISFVISFIIVMLLHWITALISYLIMIAAALICVGFTAYMWWTYASIKMKLDSTDENMMLNEMIRNESSFLTYSIISTIFTILLCLVVLYLRKRVSVVVKLFQEAGSALMAMPCLLVQPFITYISLTGFFCAWLYVVLCLATADYPVSRKVSLFHQEEFSAFNATDFNITTADAEATESEIDESIATAQELVDVQPQNRSVTLSDIATLTLIEYSDGSWIKYLWWIYIIGLVWCSEFILACQQMVIASSVAAWYFTRNRVEMKCAIMESICRLIKYHLGSIALGSLLITLVKVPRLVLKFMDRVLRKWDQNKCAQWASRGCQCCLGCFERWMRYIHHNAYTVIAIQGVGFCPAAKLAFSALVQNALQISVINSIGDSVLLLAKCISALLTGLIAVVYFQQNEKLYFYAIPVLLTVIFSYFVAHCVISVFEMAVDTLFLCFCEDHNMHVDTPDGQFYAPPSLLRYMTEDAADTVGGLRRTYKNDTAISGKIAQISATDRESYPEESIPMNPYVPTTERIED